MTTFAYGRVSKEDHGVEDRRIQFEEAGYQVDYWFADSNLNGEISALQRPRFKAMLRQIRSEDLLVVLKLDRLGKNARDIDATIKELASRDIKLIVIEFGAINLTSSTGKPMLAMLGALAEMERPQPRQGPQPDAVSSSDSQPAFSANCGKPDRTPRCQAKITPEQRAQIVTGYSLGQSISELARRHHTSRANILDIVTPKSRPDPPMPLVWGE